MIIGATKENDYQLLSTSQLLYQQYDLKRVFYSAYIPVNEDSALPSRETKPPLLREHRLYQADWLLRFYGFQADELLDEAHPNFHAQLDPKCRTGRCAIWSCFRWRSTRLSMPTFCAFPASAEIGHADCKEPQKLPSFI